MPPTRLRSRIGSAAHACNQRILNDQHAGGVTFCMSEELIAYIVLATTMAIGVALVWLIATPRKSAQSDVLAVDRKHLAHRVRRYVLAYSNANDNEKNETRKALNQAASKCRQDAGV